MMQGTFLVRLTVLGVLLAGAIFGIPRAHAVTLIPPSFEFSVQPGETIETKVKLFNETAEAITQYPSTANFSAKDETGTPSFASEADRIDLASWIQVDAGPYTLQPGERIEIPTKINVPLDAEPGGHYAGIFFSSASPEATAGGQIAISAKLGSLVLVRVAGVIREAGSIEEFSLSSEEGLLTSLPVDLTIRVQNDGNVHFRPTGNVTIRNILGGTSAVLPINQAQGAVLPSSIRKFDASWERQPVESEKLSFFQGFANEWKNFGLGAYTANVDLTYGQGGKTLNATIQFWVLPWRVLLVTIIGLALLVFLIIFLIRRYNRWILARAQQQNKKPK